MTTSTWSGTDNSNVTLSGGNLVLTSASGGDGAVRGTDSASSGKFYYEATLTAGGGTNDTDVGIANGSAVLSTAPNTTNLIAAYYPGSGTLWINGSNVATVGSAVAGNVIGVAVDLSAKLIWVRVGTGNWNGSPTDNPATGAGGKSFSGFAGPYFPFGGAHATDTWTTNFGGSAYTNGPPSGFGNWGVATGDTFANSMQLIMM